MAFESVEGMVRAGMCHIVPLELRLHTDELCRCHFDFVVLHPRFLGLVGRSMTVAGY